MSRFSVCTRFTNQILLCITMAVSCLLWPADILAEVQSKSPKIGLALSGGGARGAAHIGVLRELEKHNIHIDYIAGTSMGAIIAGLYASGMNADQIDQAYNGIDWDTVLNDSTPRRELSMRRKLDQKIFQLDKKIGFKDGKIELPAGVIRGQKLELELQKLLMHVADVVDFDQLQIPFRAIASDIASNKVVVIKNGSLSQALRASMAVPGVFTPVTIDGRLLVDGGITNNLPVDVVRQMGAEIVIAVDISSPLLKMDETVSVITIAEQLTNILVRRTTDEQIATLRENDVLIVPDLGDFSSGNFTGSPSLIIKGEQAAQAISPALTPFATAATTPALPGKKDLDTPSLAATPVISYIRIENNSRIENEMLQNMLHQQIGQPLDVPKLEKDIGRIYGLATFDSVQYSLEKKGNETGLVLKVLKQPWGPNYLQFGLSLSSDFAEFNRFSVRFGYTKMPVNSLNGEWRTLINLGEEPGIETDLYQPLAIGSPWFIDPSAFALTSKFNIIEGGNILAETNVFRIGGALAIGREFSSLGEIRAGLQRYTGTTDVIIGDPELPEEDINGGEIFLTALHDSLDDIFFPRHGWKGLFGLTGSRTELGADNDFDQAVIDVFAAKTSDKHTLHLSGRFMTTYNGQAPIYNYFRVGGLFSLPGYSENELATQNAVLFNAGYMRAFKPLLSMPAYIGINMLYGDLFENNDDIDLSDMKLAGAVYLGMKSVVGPLYIGYGLAEGGSQRVYFNIGGLY